MGPGVRRGDWRLSFEVKQFPRTAVGSAQKAQQPKVNLFTGCIHFVKIGVG